MTIAVVLVLLLGGWCLLPLPLAIAIGRAFRAGELDEVEGPAVSSPVVARR